jgi:two-component system sensor histidine kinase AlgZ
MLSRKGTRHAHARKAGPETLLASASAPLASSSPAGAPNCGHEARSPRRLRSLALRAQLDPHFLFNTLNAIAEWCREDPVVAERATLDLAALLRAVFDALQTPGWALARELALLEQLAALYAARDAGRYRFRFEVDGAATARDVPPLVLLPLFENAIKHGPAAGREGEVVLRVRAEGGDAVVSIENPGAFGGPRDGGRGLASVHRRLALAYGEGTRADFTATGATTRVTVRLPPPTLAGATP